MERPMQKTRRTPATGTTAYKVSDRVRAARANLTVRTGRLRTTSGFIFAAMLVCLGSLVWLSLTSQIVAYGYETEKMDKREVVLKRQAEQLQSEIAKYENLQRIENVAKNKLEMVPPQKAVYVKVPAELAQPAPVQIQTNSLNPVTDWWRELTEMLPRPSQPSTNNAQK